MSAAEDLEVKVCEDRFGWASRDRVDGRDVLDRHDSVAARTLKPALERCRVREAGWKRSGAARR